MDGIYLRGFTAVKTTEKFIRWPEGLSATASTKLLCRTGHCYNQQTLKLLSTPAPFLNLLNLFWNYYWGKAEWFSLYINRVWTAQDLIEWICVCVCRCVCLSVCVFVWFPNHDSCALSTLARWKDNLPFWQVLSVVCLQSEIWGIIWVLQGLFPGLWSNNRGSWPCGHRPLCWDQGYRTPRGAMR